MGRNETCETVTSLNSFFVGWLDEENNSVLKIITDNAKNTETIYRNLLEVTKHKVSNTKKPIHKDGVILTDTKSQIKNTCSEDETSNNNLKFQEIMTQIQTRKKRLFDLSREIRLLTTKIHTANNDCSSKIIAHRKAIRSYESFFNVKMTLGSSKDCQIVMHIIFENIEQHRITIIFDQNYNVISFETNSIKCNKYKELKQWFNTTTPNPANLIIKLRKYVMSC